MTNFVVQNAGIGDRWLLIGVSSESVLNHDASRAVTTATWNVNGNEYPLGDVVIEAPVTAQAHRTRTEIWGLKNPPAGSGFIQINLAFNADVVAGAVYIVNVEPGATPVTGRSAINSPNTTITLSGLDAEGIIFDNLAYHPIPESKSVSISPLFADPPQHPQWNSNIATLWGAASTTGATGPNQTSITSGWKTMDQADKGGLVAVGFKGILGPTAVRLETFTAAQTGLGTLLEWRTGMEVNNLGFNVYRAEGGERVKLNDQLIAGSVFFAGKTTVSAGHSYSWRDPREPAPAYWLEDVDTHGKSTWHGPIKPYLRSVPLPPARSATISELAAATQESGTRQARSFRAQKPVTRAATLTQAQLAQLPAVKIGVTEDGWYRLTQEQVAGAGLARVPSSMLRLFVEGQEVPILVNDGGDGRFDTGDGLYFYGTGLDTPYSNERIYWLVSGQGPGMRISTIPGGGTGQPASSFPYTAELRERLYYSPSVLNGEDDNYFGALVYGNGVKQTLDVASIAPSQPAPVTLTLSLQGLTSSDQVNPDHQVLVEFNGVTVGTILFDGQAKGSLSVPIPASQLREGQNTVKLVPQAGLMDVSFVQSIAITYARTYTADNGSLRFTAKGGQRVTVDGFSSSEALFLDITNPDGPRLLNTQARSSANGIAITATIPAATTEVAAFGAAQSPASITVNQPSRLSRLAQSANLLIIAPQTFFPSLQPLKALREKQGLKVALVDIQDIYDEFNFGEKSASAIRQFLAQARQGASRKSGPAFVLLAGAASDDPRNYTGSSDRDLVPTKIIGTRVLETASDDWFVDFNEDGVPEMAIGRLPAQDTEQLDLFVSKLTSYDQGAPVGGTLLVADSNDGFNFEAASDNLASLTKTAGAVTKLYRGQGADSASLVGALNQGYSIVNYAGHGSAVVWRGLLNTDSAGALTNGSRLSFVIAMDCMNGQFQNTQLVSLAETLLNAPNGGAVAVWASSAMCEPSGQAAMNRALFSNLFSTPPVLAKTMTLGEAVARAKASTTDPDVRRSWIFLGDPTTRLR